jgi:two-component system, OmpR family, phosphate regulon response regulator PhoB
MTATPHSIDETIRVLFIEDDPAVAEMYKLKLELDGYQVTVVSNDDQVLSEAVALNPDMIFLDLRVGEDLGFATLQRLRTTDGTRQVPVIILSRRGPHDLAGRGFKADALDYVVRADPGPSGLAWNIDEWARIESN